MRWGSRVRADSLSQINLRAGVRLGVTFTAEQADRVTGVRFQSKLVTGSSNGAGYAWGTGGIIAVSLYRMSVLDLPIPLGYGMLSQVVTNNPGASIVNPLIPMTTTPLEVGKEYVVIFENVDADPNTNWSSVDGTYTINPEADDYRPLSPYINTVLDGKNVPNLEIVYANGRSQGSAYIDVLNSAAHPLSDGVAQRMKPAVPVTVTGGGIVLTGAGNSVQLARGTWPPVGTQIIEDVPLVASGRWSHFTFSQPRVIDNIYLWWLIPKGPTSAVPLQRGSSYGYGPDTYFHDGFATIDGKPWPAIWGASYIFDLQFYLDTTS